jgi:membrane protein
VVLDQLKRRWQAARDRSPWLGVVADVQGRFNDIHGSYLASAVTLAAFLALFPLLLVAVAVLGFVTRGNPDVTRQLLDALAIPAGGDAAATIREAVATAEQSRKTASVVGLVGMLWSGLGLVAALQYAYDSVWQVTGRGLRDKAFGLLWLLGAGVLFAGSFALTAVVQFLPWFLAPLEIVAAVALGMALFLWAEKVLANRDVGWRPLLPGALAAGIGFELLKLLGSIYVPRAVASSSALYGSIGVVFAILAWLFFFGRLLVYASALNVVLWERGHGTVVIDLEVPSLPGREEDSTGSGEALRTAT